MMLSDSNPDLLRPVKSDEFLPTIDTWTTLGGLFLVGTCVTLVTLAGVIKYNTTVKAAVTVRPMGEIRLVQAATEGTIQTIRVIENQRVQSGDVIAYIDDSRLQTQKSQLREKLQQGQQQLTQLDQQTRALAAQQLAESNYLDRSIIAAEAELSRSQRDYQDRQVTTATDWQEAHATLKLARDERDRFKVAVEAGIVPQLQYQTKKQAVEVAEARLKRANAGLNPSAASVAIANEQIAQVKAQGNATLASLSQTQTLSQRRIEIVSQLNRDQQDLQQVETDLKQHVLRSPVSGTVLKLALRNPNQFVRPGDSIAQIAPNQAAPVVKALVAAQDIGEVAVGQTAQLRISAFPYPDYGTLQGIVSAIAPDTVPPTNAAPATPGQVKPATVGYYEVTIQPNGLYFVKNGASEKRQAIQPGMEGTADIISREDTLLKFLLRKARLLTNG